MSTGAIVGIVIGVIVVFGIAISIPIIIVKNVSDKNVWGRLFPSKGKRGEFRVSDILKEYVEEVGGYLIENVILPYGNRTSEVDHIVFAPAGIFVVETKNWGGEIFGKEQDETWTQVIGYRWIQKHQHPNPIKQNHIHIKAVRAHIGHSGVKFFNVIVLAQNNTHHIDSQFVVGEYELLSCLRSIKEKRYTLSTLKAMYDRINYYVEHPVATQQQHVQNIRQDHPIA